jgi:hypothetical protein
MQLHGLQCRGVHAYFIALHDEYTMELVVKV